jgi:hypothetical protein
MLSPVRRVRVLLLPWLFVAALASLYAIIGWGFLLSGHAPAVVAGALLTTVLLSASFAAVSVTRDVLRGTDAL